MKAIVLLYLSVLFSSSLRGQPSNTATFKPGRRDVQFQQASPYSSSTELRRRFSRGQAHMPPYDITKERFQLIIPESYSPLTNWGLFVWVSPSDSPKIPADWEPMLAAQQLLF